MKRYDLDGFGDRLRRLRRARGFSQQGLATLSGLGRGAIYHYEAGDSFPSLEAFVSLASGLDVTAETLLGNYPKP